MSFSILTGRLHCMFMCTKRELQRSVPAIASTIIYETGNTGQRAACSSASALRRSALEAYKKHSFLFSVPMCCNSSNRQNDYYPAYLLLFRHIFVLLLVTEHCQHMHTKYIKTCIMTIMTCTMTFLRDLPLIFYEISKTRHRISHRL